MMEVMKQGFGMHPPLNPGHGPGRYSPPYRPPERMRCMTSSSVRKCHVGEMHKSREAHSETALFTSHE